MRMLKLRPWPFKEKEEVEVYWFCTPFLKFQEGWFIRVAFKSYNSIKILEFPWGTLPYLRLGQKYMNGLLMQVKQRGIMGEVFITEEPFEICTSFDMPYNLYYLYKNYECGIQKLCKFSVEHKVYYIPCTEIVRAFLTTSKTLANYIMQPNGLDFLIEEAIIKNDFLNLNLSSEFPKSILSDETVAHLVWLKYDTEAYTAWCSVYKQLLKAAIEKPPQGNQVKNMMMGTPIELFPSINKHCKWCYRGITDGNNILILELLATTGFRFPFKHIDYYHPSFDRKKSVEVGDKIKRASKEGNEIYELPNPVNPHGSKMKQNQPVIEASQTTFVFDNSIRINRLKGKDKEVKNSVQLVSIEGKQGITKEGKSIISSTEDWSKEGKIEPIEFQNLELVQGRIGKGLEQFYKAIEYIRLHYKWLQVSLSEVFLPYGKRFSIYPNGDRRTCAIARINISGEGPCYILEIGRVDNWAISTLFLWGNDGNLKMVNCQIDLEIERILQRMVLNNGHWDKEVIEKNNKYRFYRMKHISIKSIESFASRIIRKVLTNTIINLN